MATARKSRRFRERENPDGKNTRGHFRPHAPFKKLRRPQYGLDFQNRRKNLQSLYYKSRFRLSGSEIRNYKNLSKSDWKIAAASLCPVSVPVERLKGAFITHSKDYAPFEPSKTIAKGSALDFSWLIDAPAGKYGFAYAKDGEIFLKTTPASPRAFTETTCASRQIIPTRKMPTSSQTSSRRPATTFCAYTITTTRLSTSPLPIGCRSTPKSSTGSTTSWRP